jgi:FKBP-type peptidyl-prolyl cis-trans isomerase FkpA
MNYIVKYEVIQKVKDSVLFSSYKEVAPQYVQVQPVFSKVAYSDIRGNIMELMPRLKKGDSVYIVQSSDSLIAQNPEAVKYFKKGQDIVTTIRVVDVFKTPEEANVAFQKDNEPKMKAAIANAEKMDQENLERFKSDTGAQNSINRDNKIIEAYLAKNKIQAQKTPWGTYIQIINPGEGPKPGPGKWANVKYVGTHLNGGVFDQGVFPYQVSGQQSPVKGFDEGVRQLAKGGKAKIFIPSVLAYGPQGSGDKIKPNEILVFDIELLDITDQQPAPQAPTAEEPKTK